MHTRSPPQPGTTATRRHTTTAPQRNHALLPQTAHQLLQTSSRSCCSSHQVCSTRTAARSCHQTQTWALRASSQPHVAAAAAATPCALPRHHVHSRSRRSSSSSSTCRTLSTPSATAAAATQASTPSTNAPTADNSAPEVAAGAGGASAAVRAAAQQKSLQVLEWQAVCRQVRHRGGPTLLHRRTAMEPFVCRRTT